MKKTLRLIKEQGLNTTFKKIKNKVIRMYNLQGKFKPTSVMDLIYDLEHNIRPMHTVNVQRAKQRFNIVIDSINEDSLFGGAAAAIIIGSKIAAKNSMELRIITRKAHINTKAYFDFIREQKVEKPMNVEFYSDFDKIKNINLPKLEVSENDIFMATSWWTAYVIDMIIPNKKFFYLLQESEIIFYPNNDERLLCESVMKKENIDFIVNSGALFEYFREIKSENIIRNGCFFEPAFPEALFKPGVVSFEKKDRYKLFFYKSPNNTENLYKTGLKYLNDAVSAGIIDLNKWDIFIAGSDAEPFIFSNGKRPVIKGRMSWKEYSGFASTVDVAFCLMYTPYPSYPLLDMAASGAVVLTSFYLNKAPIKYFKNIIISGFEQMSMLEGFNKAVSLAIDTQKREANYKAGIICRSWDKAIEPVEKFIMEKIKN